MSWRRLVDGARLAAGVLAVLVLAAVVVGSVAAQLAGAGL